MTCDTKGLHLDEIALLDFFLVELMRGCGAMDVLLEMLCGGLLSRRSRRS